MAETMPRGCEDPGAPPSRTCKYNKHYSKIPHELHALIAWYAGLHVSGPSSYHENPQQCTHTHCMEIQDIMWKKTAPLGSDPVALAVPLGRGCQEEAASAAGTADEGWDREQGGWGGEAFLGRRGAVQVPPDHE